MSAVVVDTSCWITYFAGREVPGLEEALREARVYLPGLVASELLSGRLSKTWRRRLVDFLEELPLCDASLAQWVRAGELRSALARKGLSISTPDAHIAQCCLDLDGELMSEDRVFRRIAERTALMLHRG